MAVEKQVTQMSEAHEPDDEIRFKQRLGYCEPALSELGLGDRAGFQEQLKIVADELADIQARRARRQKNSGAYPFAGFLQQAADTPMPEPQPKPTLKRQHESGAPEADANATPSNDTRDGRAPGSKKTKRGSSKVEQRSDETRKPSPTKPRVNIRAEIQDDTAQHELSNSKYKAAEAKKNIKPGPKRRGRPSKEPEHSSASDRAVQDKTKENPKRQGENKHKVQESPVGAKADDRPAPRKKTAVDKAQRSKTKASDSGLRRSARIADKAKTRLT